MPEFPRDLPHFYLRGNGKPEPYASKIRGRGRELPQRERLAHSDALNAALSRALEAVQLTRAERDPELLTGTPGFYLDFEIPAGSEAAAELLENRPKRIELVAIRQESKSTPAQATVFVPDSATDHFRRKIEQYRTEDTRPRKSKDPHAAPLPGRPKNEGLIARISDIRFAEIRSIYTGDPASPPADGERIWWEVCPLPGPWPATQCPGGVARAWRGILGI